MKPGFRVSLETGFHVPEAPYFKGFRGLSEVHALLTQNYRGRRAHRSHRWGAKAERRQWRMKRGGGVLSKRALPAAAPQGDYCEADRAQRDHRFESSTDHSLPSREGIFLPFRAVLPCNPPLPREHPNPCLPTFSGQQGPHTSQQRGNQARVFTSAMSLPFYPLFQPGNRLQVCLFYRR